MKFGLTDAQRWPTIIITVLVAQIGFGIWMARLAGSDPHFAIEPDYYNKAVNWDARMAQSRADRALGWQSTATLSRGTSGAGILDVSLTDSLGTAVVADSVLVEAMPVAHAQRVTRLTLTSEGAGYRGTLPDAGTAGLWEVRVRALRGRDIFTANVRAEMP